MSNTEQGKVVVSTLVFIKIATFKNHYTRSGTIINALFTTKVATKSISAYIMDPSIIAIFMKPTV